MYNGSPLWGRLAQLYLIQLLYPSSSYTLSNSGTPSSSPAPPPTCPHTCTTLYCYTLPNTQPQTADPSPTHAHNFIALAYVVIMYSHPRKPAQPHWDHQTSIFSHQPICLRQHHSFCFIQQQHHSSCLIQQPTSRSRTSPSTSKTGYQDRVRSIY